MSQEKLTASSNLLGFPTVGCLRGLMLRLLIFCCDFHQALFLQSSRCLQRCSSRGPVPHLPTWLVQANLAVWRVFPTQIRSSLMILLAACIVRTCQSSQVSQTAGLSSVAMIKGFLLDRSIFLTMFFWVVMRICA